MRVTWSVTSIISNGSQVSDHCNLLNKRGSLLKQTLSEASLGSRGRYRDIDEQHGMLALREPAMAYKTDVGGELPL